MQIIKLVQQNTHC